MIWTYFVCFCLNMLCVFFVGPEIVSASPWNDLIWNDSDFSFGHELQIP